MVSRNRRSGRMEEEESDGIQSRTVNISRVSKTVKGGRNLSFSAVVVVGDGNGSVGIGQGKASAVPDAIRKGETKAKRNMVQVTLSGSTIPHDVVSMFGASEVMMKPARPGTGVIAGGAVRAVVELAGIKDIVTKARRSTNPLNTVKAAFQGLRMLRDIKVEMERRQRLIEAPPPPRRRDRQRRRPPRLEPRPRPNNPGPSNPGPTNPGPGIPGPGTTRS